MVNEDVTTPSTNIKHVLNLTTTIFRDVTPCSLVQTYSSFRGTFLNLYQATQHHIPQENNLNSH